ncbi:PAS domain-containing protein [Roseateles chitinivorans]|uniref:PAS domain-containing protein n=1 Tax=Roseateles chitinivorans TaxID=2917965 RepID=UPI003D669EE1
MNDKAFETPWHLVWCADVASQRLLHVSASVERLLGLSPQALLDDPIQWNHAVLPADAGELPRPFCADDLPHGDGFVREYRIIGADLHLYRVRDRRFRRRDPRSGALRTLGVIEAVGEVPLDLESPAESSWQQLWDESAGLDGPAVTPVGAAVASLETVERAMAASPKTGQPRRSEEERPAEPPAPGPEQAPHEHPDDPGVHPDGPKRYHDDHAAPARQELEQGEPA